ncbi:MAG: multicopper oxidase domain-containing protein [Phaeodactylibacter sp.]|nr:multicopper oxidase domain-containing protein [Phaeodactylibacter sp.]MCB9052342.1 multicopper oxidase domain-containing protein [Lewinellaceae bacterium]
MNFVLLLAAFFLAPWSSQAQVNLLDAVTHPKYVENLPLPGKINATNGGYFRMDMREVTQHLGLYTGGVATPANKLYTKVWGYGMENGTITYPGPTFVAMEDVGIDVSWNNNLPNTHLLPVDQTLHWAAPPRYPRNGQPTVVHLHGGHTESASDGLPEAWFTRRFRDRGPNWVKKVYHYDNDQEAATLWYHDHALGITRLNVYAGLAGFYFLRDQNEMNLINNGTLPSGDYEREIVLQDRYFTNDGQLFLPSKFGDPFFEGTLGPEFLDFPNPSIVAEFFGDFMIVNGVAWPKLEVEQTKYRFRMLNGSDSRFYVLYLDDEGTVEEEKLPILQIGVDDGFLNNPVPVPNNELVIAPGERADIVIDFSQLPAGTRLIMKNRGPDGPFKGFNEDGDLDDGDNGVLDPANPLTTGQIMAFDVVDLVDDEPTFSVNTSSTLNNIVEYNLADADNTRRVAFFEGMDAMGRLQPIHGIINGDDPKVYGSDNPAELNGSLAWFEPITENPMLNDIEVWEAWNFTEDAHPMHLHLVAFNLLDIAPIEISEDGGADGGIVVIPQDQEEHHSHHSGNNGVGRYVVESSILETGPDANVGIPVPPAANQRGWKDTFILPPGTRARVIAKFDRPGRYVWHCHILSHEDHEMMRPYEVLLPIPRPVDPIVADYHPAEAALAANYPNPTSGSTTIPFFLPADDNIRVDIVDINGRPVKELASGLYPAGNHQLEWNGTNSAGSLVPSGIYIYQLHTSNEVFSQQMIIQR